MRLGGAGDARRRHRLPDRQFLGIRTDEALYRFFGRNAFGGPVGMSVHHFGDVDAEKAGAGWTEWIARVYSSGGRRGAVTVLLFGSQMAPITLTVRDETTTGKELATLELQLEAEQVTVAGLIRARVHQEVRAHNAASALAPQFNGLVQPERTELELNGERRGRRSRPVDAERQTEVALNAFERGHDPAARRRPPGRGARPPGHARGPARRSPSSSSSRSSAAERCWAGCAGGAPPTARWPPSWPGSPEELDTATTCSYAGFARNTPTGRRAARAAARRS